ncbi:uncharacterized protein CDV56_105792 [Aspergillus thermomutatus]|uniref:Uncharacterized protein n=1 Tax=Aspergillus thermomutatus TaxID=41047 RepID=A0A397H9J1_ASPTH|nr:uncharacterized protein CDV56_105792 [Aspergillus thermomutatus]RHZ59722.1 hypothetical protein CDV56_105792 [Aspergillus thermomutatus]
MEPPAQSPLKNLQSASSEPSTATFNSGDAAAQLVEGLQHHPFTSSQSLHMTLEKRRQALEQDKTRDQYLLFTAVPPAVFSRLSDDRSRTSKLSRFSYSETGTLVAKVMPSPEHHLSASSFEFLINLELHSMGLRHDVDSLGSATVTIGTWKKEADCCWAPAQQDTELSFVVEVGLSESARHLALDARWWLEARSSSVKLVVTIGINRMNPEVIMQRWEILPGEYHPLAGSSPGSARPSATITIYRTNNTTFISGGQLELPFEKVAGRQANRPTERNLIVPEQRLRNFAEKIWRKQGFL